MAESPEAASGSRRRPPYGEGVDAIREAATSIAATRGLAGVTLRAVAEQAGVSHALVRHHFGTRDRLVESAVSGAVERTHYLDDSGDAALSARIDATVGELRVQYEAMLAGDRPESVESAYARYREEVRRWLGHRSLPMNDDIVLLLVAALDGLAMQRLARGEDVDVDTAFMALERLLSGGTDSQL